MEEKKATKLFEYWLDNQELFDDINIEHLKKELDGKNISFLKSKWLSYSLALKPFQGFFCLFLGKRNSKIEDLSDLQIKKTLSLIYDLIENDLPKFISYLKDDRFIKIFLGKNGKKVNSDSRIRMYKNIMRLLFYKRNALERKEILFAVANRFFEYCFSKKTWPEFEQIILNKKWHPIAEFLYTVMWWNFGEEGWLHWNQKTLTTLKEKSNKGNEIVYIAGGNDIYHLIKAGIYNIRVIDPFFTSQFDYYSGDWRWFVKGRGKNGGEGDKFLFDLDNNNIFMKRKSFKEKNQTFSAVLSTGKRTRIQKSETVWNVLDKKNKILGTVTFERRFINQKDFEITKNKTFLVSFNELYFISIPKEYNGWGIDPYKFSSDMEIFVKQLHLPVSKQNMCNIRTATESEFNFIDLGSCID